MSKLPSGNRLLERARELGIDTNDNIAAAVAGSVRAPEHELQRRVLEAERAIRESRMWLLALISALASVASAIAAILAVVRK